MTNYIFYQSREYDFPTEWMDKFIKEFDMKKVGDNKWIYRNDPDFQIRILNVSLRESFIRKKNHEMNEDKKITENIYLLEDEVYSCFYDGDDSIFMFVEENIQKEIDIYNQKHHPKYTKFRDIPQLTRCGNWECDFTFPELVKYIENEIQEQGLQMEPDFQRGHVWTEAQQIAFIEFFLRGGKTGRVIYLNNPSWNFPNKEYNEYVCVDGLQRYTAIKRFINNEIPVFGTYYKDFEDRIRATNTMRLNINDLQSRKEVLQWYIEFNAGGTPHSEDEINRVRMLLDKED